MVEIAWLSKNTFSSLNLRLLRDLADERLIVTLMGTLPQWFGDFRV